MSHNDRFTRSNAKGAEIMSTILHSNDPDEMRSMLTELIMATGYWYRRTQIHILLHPIIFLAGFVTAYLFTR